MPSDYFHTGLGFLLILVIDGCVFFPLEISVFPTIKQSLLLCISISGAPSRALVRPLSSSQNPFHVAADWPLVLQQTPLTKVNHRIDFCFTELSCPTQNEFARFFSIRYQATGFFTCLGAFNKCYNKDHSAYVNFARYVNVIYIPLIKVHNS